MNFLFNLLAEASSSISSSGDPQQQNPLSNLWVWLIPIGAIIILMVISSRQRKKQQEVATQKLNNIKVGDQVKTIGLIYGEIVEVDPDMETFVIKTGSDANPSYIKVDKMAIYQVIPPLSAVVENSGEEQVAVENGDVFEENAEIKQEENVEVEAEESAETKTEE